MEGEPPRHERLAVEPHREASLREIAVQPPHKGLIVASGVGEKDSGHGSGCHVYAPIGFSCGLAANPNWRLHLRAGSRPAKEWSRPRRLSTRRLRRVRSPCNMRVSQSSAAARRTAFTIGSICLASAAAWPSLLVSPMAGGRRCGCRSAALARGRRA